MSGHSRWHDIRHKRDENTEPEAEPADERRPEKPTPSELKLLIDKNRATFDYDIDYDK
jgi:hypothetical protein